MRVILLIFLMGFIFSCSDRNDIPTGDKTFSCEINGKLFTPKYSDLNTMPTNNGLSIDKGLNNWKDLLIIAQNSDTETKIILYIKDYAVGSYPLYDSLGNTFPSNLPTSQATAIFNGKKYLSKNNISGQINITTKTDSDLKGNFELKLYNENNINDFITIKNGKFDD